MASKKPGYKSKPKADIDFEAELWEAANELRGAVAENQYKEYVLSLLFVKHVSERFQYRYEELKKEINNPASYYYTTKEKEQQEILNDDLEYTSRNIYRLPPDATWDYLRDNAGTDDIKVKVDNAFILIEIMEQADARYRELVA